VLPEEVKETQVYFSSQINIKMIEIDKCLKENPDLLEDIKKDLKEIDNESTELACELKDNVANEAVIEALIQNYKIKLTIMEEVLSSIKQSENINLKKEINENTEI